MRGAESGCEAGGRSERRWGRKLQTTGIRGGPVMEKFCPVDRPTLSMMKYPREKQQEKVTLCSPHCRVGDSAITR